MNRIDRLTGMILLLQGQRVITAERIAEHFEVSVRTVYRDLAALGEAGVPIVAEAGVGYSLMRGYHMPPVMFTEDEAAALFMSCEVAGQVADGSLRQSLRAAMLKIRSVLPEERKDYLNRLNHTIGVYFRRPDGEGKRDSLMPVQDAIARRRCLAIRYNTANRGAITHRVVEPLGLVFYAHQWHLIAWCRLRQDARDFRLDRMASWDVLDENFSGHEGFSVKDFVKDCDDGCELVPVTVRVALEAVERFRLEMPCTPLVETTGPGAWVELELLAFSLDWLANWLLGFGTKAEAVAPEELRVKVRTAALAVAERHGEIFSVV